MLLGTGPGTEPGIIGNIDKPAWPRLRGIDNRVRENHFIADQGRHRRRRQRSKHMRMISGTKAGAHRELLNTDTVKKAGERHIFAEWHQMELVIDLRRATWAKQVKAVVSYDPVLAAQHSVRTGDKGLASPCEKRDPVQRSGGARHGKTCRGF